jgi:hypothetical protein
MGSHRYLLALMATVATPCYADCSKEIEAAIGPGTTTARFALNVPQGAACGGLLRTIEQYQYGGQFIVLKSLTVGQAPLHGQAGVLGRGRFAYRASPGFVGDDHFVLTLNYDEFWTNGNSTTPTSIAASIDIDVSVR